MCASKHSLWCSFHHLLRDNPETDIYGGNLYNRYLQRRRNLHLARRRVARADFKFLDDDSDDDEFEDISSFQRDSGANVRAIQSLEEDTSDVEKASGCESILVCTGVYNKNSNVVMHSDKVTNHNHRDFVIDPGLTRPNHVVPSVLEAVKLVFEKENYKSWPKWKDCCPSYIRASTFNLFDTSLSDK